MNDRFVYSIRCARAGVGVIVTYLKERQLLEAILNPHVCFLTDQDRKLS